MPTRGDMASLQKITDDQKKMTEQSITLLRKQIASYDSEMSSLRELKRKAESELSKLV